MAEIIFAESRGWLPFIPFSSEAHCAAFSIVAGACLPLPHPTAHLPFDDISAFMHLIKYSSLKAAMWKGRRISALSVPS